MNQNLMEPLFMLNYETGGIDGWWAESFEHNEALDEWTATLRDGNPRYTWRDSPIANVHHSVRIVANVGGFFVPHLRPGMRLLDCGCGPGTIPVGLAELVAPGGVNGVRELDLDSIPIAPQNPLLDRFVAVWIRLTRDNGGDTHIGKRLKVA